MGRVRVLRAIITIGSLILIVVLSGSLLELWGRRDIVEERRQALAKEEAENKRLKDALVEAQTPAFVEKQAREKLGLLKEGEVVVLVPAEVRELSQKEGKRKDENLPNWKRWVRLFF